jgi:hypothetical protein
MSAFRVPSGTDAGNGVGGFHPFRVGQQGGGGQLSSFRSSSPFLLPPGMSFPTPGAYSTLHSPAGVSVPSSAVKTPMSISPIQGTPIPLGNVSVGSGSAPGSTVKSQNGGEGYEKSVLHQFAQLSSEALDRSSSQSPPTISGMTPTTFSAIPMLQGVTPLCVIQPKNGNSSASSGSFSDQSVLFSSLNNSLGSVSSNSSQNWIQNLDGERAMLTPQLGLRFTPDVLKWTPLALKCCTLKDKPALLASVLRRSVLHHIVNNYVLLQRILTNVLLYYGLCDILFPGWILTVDEKPDISPKNHNCRARVLNDKKF